MLENENMFLFFCIQRCPRSAARWRWRMTRKLRWWLTGTTWHCRRETGSKTSRSARPFNNDCPEDRPLRYSYIRVTSHKRHGVSDNGILDCLINSLLRQSRKKASTYYWRISGFPLQRSSNAESISMLCSQVMLQLETDERILTPYQQLVFNTNTFVRILTPLAWKRVSMLLKRSIGVT